MRIRQKTVMDQMNAERADDVLADLEAKHGCAAPPCSAAEYFDVCDDLRTQQECVRTDTTRLLERRGWRYHCQNPGGLWLFEKKLPDGRIALVGEGHAIAIEDELATAELEQGG